MFRLVDRSLDRVSTDTRPEEEKKRREGSNAFPAFQSSRCTCGQVVRRPSRMENNTTEDRGFESRRVQFFSFFSSFSSSFLLLFSLYVFRLSTWLFYLLLFTTSSSSLCLVRWENLSYSTVLSTRTCTSILSKNTSAPSTPYYYHYYYYSVLPLSAGVSGAGRRRAGVSACIVLPYSSASYCLLFLLLHPYQQPYTVCMCMYVRR